MTRSKAATLGPDTRRSRCVLGMALCLTTATRLTNAHAPSNSRKPHCASKGDSRKIVDRFLDAGGNFLDTADVYSKGLSEEITGRAIKAVRDDVVLATKVFFPMGEGPNDIGLSRKHVTQGCEDSLRRLGTDYIDLYQVHCWDSTTPLEETLSALTDLVRSGKVRYIGVSNFTGWQLMKSVCVSEANGFEKFVCL